MWRRRACARGFELRASDGAEKKDAVAARIRTDPLLVRARRAKEPPPERRQRMQRPGGGFVPESVDSTNRATLSAVSTSSGLIVDHPAACGQT